MMNPLRVDEHTPVLVQGITGRVGRLHTRLMRAYGTRIVGGVSPRAQEVEVEGVPVFRSCREAVRVTGAEASVVMVPSQQVLEAIGEAVEAGIRLVVSVTEGMPVYDALRALRLVRETATIWIGPSTPGLAVPGRAKLGFLPDIALRPGPLGVMSRSGTLSYEVCYRLAQRGVGQSMWVGVGGDLVKGTRFRDLYSFFVEDPGTKAILVIGEIGGNEEEELAKRMREEGCPKPVFVLLAGQQAPEGITMGHAGALLHGAHGTITAKRRALEAAGASVHLGIDDLVETVALHFGNKMNSGGEARGTGR